MKTRFITIAAMLAAVAVTGTADAAASRCAAQEDIDRSAIDKEIIALFMDYARIDSRSRYPEEGTTGFTMTPGQHVMAERLLSDVRQAVSENNALDVSAVVSEDNYVYVRIPATEGVKAPVLGISCHLDISPEVDFGDHAIVPVLDKLDGVDIIRSDGSTLLGADDKCGCTVSMLLIRDILASGKPHGEVQFVFCPNEDVGMAAERMDTARFSPDILFDIDGEHPYGITDSNFTAKALNLLFKGNSVHPSDAKALGLGDATAAAAAFIAGIPLQHRPEHSEGKEGYIHPWNFTRRGQDVLVETRIRYFSPDDGELFDRVTRESLMRVRADYPNVGIETVYEGIQYENVAGTLHPAAHGIVLKAATEAFGGEHRGGGPSP